MIKVAFTCIYVGGGRVIEKMEPCVEEVILSVQYELCVSRNIFLSVANTCNAFICFTFTRGIVTAIEKNVM